jgi:hypothetical protein
MYHEHWRSDIRGGGESNSGTSFADNAGMVAMGLLALLWARETSGPDDDGPWNGDDGDARRADEDAANDNGPLAKTLLRMRCFACGGSGRLEVTDEGCPRGRTVRCVACHGRGRVFLK